MAIVGNGRKETVLHDAGAETVAAGGVHLAEVAGCAGSAIPFGGCAAGLGHLVAGYFIAGSWGIAAGIEFAAFT